VASEDVAAREAAYEAAAKPERHRADMAMDALRAVQDRQRELVQAALDDEDNDALTKRRKILGYAEEVLALQDAKLAEVMQAREAARQDLDAVLEKRREARRELQRIEDSLAQPLAADIGAWAHFQALFFSWPYRLAAAKWGFGPPLSQGEENAGRLLAGLYADFAGVIPDGAARKVREMDQGQHAKSTANALNSMTIPMGDGRQMNVGQLLGLSSGLAGR
jgi:hypothetical protein